MFSGFLSHYMILPLSPSVQLLTSASRPEPETKSMAQLTHFLHKVKTQRDILIREKADDLGLEKIKPGYSVG